jgi:hypothetical protein
MVHNINKRIICSGNPDGHPDDHDWQHTVAHGVREFFPDTKFVHRSNGYDLRLWDDQRRESFVNLIKNSTVFINASKICQLGQLNLLNLTYDTVIKNNIKDYTVINIGSTAEFDPAKFEMYSIEKNALKERSRQLADKGFRSSHITIGNLNNVFGVAKTIKLVLESDPFISLVKIEH